PDPAAAARALRATAPRPGRIPAPPPTVPEGSVVR
ncbi:MAG: hypothetical protein QOE44_1123, partial [Solirubrobacteraceae bacterium]|nr:hypothetical protein [Solirubrobacteraceae bacterium]